MNGGKGGSSAPSYKDAISSRSKSLMGNSKYCTNERNMGNEKEVDGTITQENNCIKDKEEEDKSQGSRDKKQKVPCKPKA